MFSCLAAILAFAGATAASAQNAEIKRGQYLVTLAPTSFVMKIVPPEVAAKGAPRKP